MELVSNSRLRTRVYIDGYNLYCGCLKFTAHRWLDVHALVERILPSVHYSLSHAAIQYYFGAPAIKFFTARILTAFARSEDAVACQAAYLSALRSHLGDALEVIMGYHDARAARAHAWMEGRAARECEVLDVWKLEEKQSDVSLALHAFSDAIRGEIEHVIFITNDSDFAPAMQMIRRDTSAVVGLIVPVRGEKSVVNAELARHAHWVRKGIRPDELAVSQLPPMVRRLHTAVHKPLSWYPRPDLLVPVYDEVKRMKGSPGAARKWLNQPCMQLGGQTPIDLCESSEDCAVLWKYLNQYAERHVEQVIR